VQGSALGFSFLILVLVVFAALVALGTSTAKFLGEIQLFDSLMVFTALIVLTIGNIFIVYGLKKQMLWAIFLGSIEVVVLMVTVFVSMWLDDFSSIIGSSAVLLLMIGLLSSIYNDYLTYKNSDVPHV
jgi:hypothetical protein